ncbi:MAG TPA: GNAT family N-acetyltransferase [Gammaproteobacteria bacterium]|nr:GNAT family N-acetyltransferase [Gammaproteobacteria bacterium]
MKYTLKTTRWKKDKTALSAIRRKVFIEEQNVPEELEWDEDDALCKHILVTDEDNNCIATGRIKPEGHIGRMAVLKECRHSGIGSTILRELIKIARAQKLEKVFLHAQTTAIEFYKKQGFETCSDEFMDAGIPHKAMEKKLTS